MDPNGQNNRNLTATADVRERRPRIDPSGTVAVFERIEADGKGQIWIFVTTPAQRGVTTGGDGGRRRWPARPTSWAPTPTPTSRPTAARRVPPADRDRQRRARALGPHDRPHRRHRPRDDRGRGRPSAARPTGARAGIVFAEIDGAGGRTQVVIVQPDGTGRRAVLTTAAAGFDSRPRAGCRELSAGRGQRRLAPVANIPSR